MSTKKVGKKVKCWLCGNWQDGAYTVVIEFNDSPEVICLNCKLALDTREDALEQKRIELEAYSQEAEVTQVTNENNQEGGDPDEIPAKEDFLP
jgi:transcription elongation factor Elf1